MCKLWMDLKLFMFPIGLRDNNRRYIYGYYTAFALDECGWWEDKLYRSLIAANIYAPAAYPAGWESVSI